MPRCKHRKESLCHLSGTRKGGPQNARKGRLTRNGGNSSEQAGQWQEKTKDGGSPKQDESNDKRFKIKQEIRQRNPTPYVPRTVYILN